MHETGQSRTPGSAVRDGIPPLSYRAETGRSDSLSSVISLTIRVGSLNRGYWRSRASVRGWPDRGWAARLDF